VPKLLPGAARQAKQQVPHLQEGHSINEEGLFLIVLDGYRAMYECIQLCGVIPGSWVVVTKLSQKTALGSCTVVIIRR
jgi:hypothetical protein